MRFRFFLDAGAGVCLWAQDDAARARFGYAVALDDLPLPRDLVVDLMNLMADYDASIDWNDPGRTERDTGPTAFGYEQDAPFRERVLALLTRLRAALESGFEIESDFEG